MAINVVINVVLQFLDLYLKAAQMLFDVRCHLVHAGDRMRLEPVAFLLTNVLERLQAHRPGP